MFCWMLENVGSRLGVGPASDERLSSHAEKAAAPQAIATAAQNFDSKTLCARSMRSREATIAPASMYDKNERLRTRTPTSLPEMKADYVVRWLSRSRVSRSGTSPGSRTR